MPIYEYMCIKCKEKFAYLQGLHPAENTTECPRCFSTDVKKLISSFSYAKGSGHASTTMSTPKFGGGGG